MPRIVITGLEYWVPDDGATYQFVARPMQQLTLFDLHPPAPVTRRTRNGPTDARTSREITDRFYSTRAIERYVRRRAEGAD